MKRAPRPPRTKAARIAQLLALADARAAAAEDPERLAERLRDNGGSNMLRPDNFVPVKGPRDV